MTPRIAPLSFLGLLAVTAVVVAGRVGPAAWQAPGGAADPRAPDTFTVRLDTTKGVIDVACTRAWAPHGADRFHALVEAGYYDDSAIFRIRPKTWAQFGINGTPEVARTWRERPIPDDPLVQPNVRGTVAFAWAVPNGRTTQVFINLRDNRDPHDKEPFVPFGLVVRGMEVADALYDGYGEAAGGGIRAGRQQPVFDGGNAYLRQHFSKLDYIRRARVISPAP